MLFEIVDRDIVRPALWAVFDVGFERASAVTTFVDALAITDELSNACE